MYDFSQFEKDLLFFNIKLDDEKKNRLASFYDLLKEWNSYMNLTAITEWDDVLKKHFLDSLSIVRAVKEIRSSKWNVIDVGTGAGFPGIPLKIVFPELRLTLLDSLQKRILFLNTVIDKLDLKDVRTVHGRAEDLARNSQMRECYDVCVSRAVANLATLSELCLPFVRKEGVFVSYKTEKNGQEAENAARAIQLLGGNLESRCAFLLPNSDLSRMLFVIRKIMKTPEKYPRKAGIPGRQPL